jgi:cytochrome c5
MFTTSKVLFLLAASALLSPAAFGSVSGTEAPRPGAEIYTTHCAECHNSGWQGAPAPGDPYEWDKRRKAGFEKLFKHTKEGIGSMPPMGMCDDCTDAELKLVIEEMLK